MVTENSGSVPPASSEVGHPRWLTALLMAVVWVAVAWVLVQLDWDEAASEILRVAGALAAWAFVWRFSQVDWHSTYEGRHIMGYTVITAVFLTFAATIAIIHNFIGHDVLIVALYGWLLVLITERHRLFTKGQRERIANDKVLEDLRNPPETVED